MAIITTTNQTELSSSFIRMDAEFFRPQHVQAYKQLDGINGRERLGRICEKLTQGSNPVFSDSGYPCVNGKNVYFGTMREGEPNYVSEAEFRRHESFRLREGDIVITLKHATKIGRAWIVEDKEPRIFSRNVGLIRLAPNSPLRGSVLLLYLWTIPGQLCLDRCATGGTSGQITLPISELKRLPIPKFPEDSQKEIDEMFSRSRAAKSSSESSYAEAQYLLEYELGLNKLRFQKPVGFTAGFSDIEQSLRLDAHHYQPRFLQLLDHLAGFPSKRIRDIRTCNRRGLQPVYAENGAINVVNSQHLGPKHIDYDGLQKTSELAFASATEGHIRNDDLLIYTTGAYIGRTNAYLSNVPALASNHVNILRLVSGIDAAYMALIFQSVIGQFQTQKHARGSAQAELYPSDIDRFVVPLLNHTKQEAIGNLVRESLERQRESKRLLDQAKTRVEQLIEKAVRS
jgi:type I restriction enzyme, S subunit